MTRHPRVLIVSPEAAPFAVAGGLGEAARGLASTLSRQGAINADDCDLENQENDEGDGQDDVKHGPDRHGVPHLGQESRP